MHSIPSWKLAPRPNYVTNTDKVYPYSEVPYLGQYRLVKLPPSLNNLVEHVDYWGEGKITSELGISGFSNCYNVNHTYQLVSNGPDRDRKIPNRIPVVSYTNCDTSSYIKDNSVNTVTVMGAPINTSCAKDIARMVNPDFGKVIAYGFESSSQDITNLTTELRNKSLFYCPKYTLPTELRGLTLFDSEIAFLNLTLLKEQLYNNITDGSYEVAVDLTKIMDNETSVVAITEVVTKLIRESSSNVMAYGYQLWNSGGEDIIHKSFPGACQLIFKQDIVTIVNKQHQQALKLDAKVDSYNDRLAWGDSSDKTSKKVSWQIKPTWEYDNVLFKLYNVGYSMYLKLDANTDDLGDRKVWGSTEDHEINHRYYVVPLMKDETVVFRLINNQYHQVLKLDVNVNAHGDRLLWGHNGDPQGDNEAFYWIIAANTTLEKEVIEKLKL